MQNTNRIGKMIYKLVLLAICFVFIHCGKPEDSQATTEESDDDPIEVVIPKVDTIKPSIQVDLGFPYYQNRSIESIVDELVLNGYQIVHYFVASENSINKEFIKEFIEELHNADVEVWLMTVGNGTYSTANFPTGWQEWKMTLKETTNGSSGFTFFSNFNQEFVQWKKKKLVELVTMFPFDGIELAEAYFPAWNGPANPGYGDIGPNAAKAFKEAYGLDIPNFEDSSASNYYTKIPSTYNKWIQFRINGVNEFLNEIYNGVGGVREKRPDIKVATWSLAINAGNNSPSLLKEYQGLDVPAMVELVKPDVHYIQTHWPDWLKSESELPPNYIRDYNNFLSEIKEVDKTLPVGIQADIGSDANMIKSGEWLEKFSEYAKEAGYSTYTAYEYHIGGYIYEEAPKVLKANRIAENGVQLSFSKRVRIPGNEWKKYFKFFQNQKEIYPEIKSVKLDGNQIIIYFEVEPNGAYVIEINEIEDTPDLWLHSGFKANQIEPHSKIEVGM